MKTDKDIWTEEVLSSFKGMERAQPAADLFSKIETKLLKPEARVIPLHWIRAAAVAAVLILGFNIYGVYEYAQSDTANTQQTSGEQSIELINSYNLYE